MSIGEVLADERPWWIERSDVRAGLAVLPDASVHCIVTSPPYWGLRAYGTEPQIWGGDPECRHEWGDEGKSTQRLRNGIGSDTAKVAFGEVLHPRTGALCSCGAWRGELGLEPNPSLYTEHLCEVFRECRRVLRADGTLWLNVGDSYSGSGKGNNPNGKQGTNAGTRTDDLPTHYDGLPSKSLIGLPWRLAFALQEDGWILRSDIVWAKPAPMPESVTDRPTRSHEYIFLFAKSSRYFYDADAIREPQTEVSIARRDRADFRLKPGRDEAFFGNPPKGIESSDWLGGRNARSVWTIGPSAFPEAHFATFPPELPERCIKAGTAERGIVLDPFSGAGTTVMVARRLGRRGIGLELNADYAAMSRRRISEDMPMFNREASFAPGAW